MLLALLRETLKKINDLRKGELKLVSKVFLLGIGLGIIFSMLIFQDRQQFVEFLTTAYESILKRLNKFDFLNFFTLIYFQNLRVVALTIFLGLLYKYLPLVIIFSNGIFLGLVILGVITFDGGIVSLGALIPHGIFEIPAFLLSAAVGMHLSKITEGQGFRGRLQALFKSKLEISFIAFLLLIAAAIESATITFFKN